MKIGLVLEQFDPTKGGLEHWTWQFARDLQRRGHEVHVVAFDFHPEGEVAGFTLHKMGEMPRSRLARAGLLAERLSALELDLVHDMGIGWHADIIHPHGGSTVALWEQNLRRIPKWRQIRFWRERRYRELAEVERRQHFESKAVIVAVSHMVRRHFETLHRLPASRVRVIPNGVNIERFTPKHRDTLRMKTRRELGVDDEVLFLMLAHNLLLKNAEAFLRSAAVLVTAGAPVRLVIAGGKNPEPFVRLVEKLGIARVVTFAGAVDSVPHYAAADVFVHPTWYDPCSLVTLEASAAGLPVITTRCNGASELMTDGREGFLLDDPADYTSLAARMKELLDPARRASLGRSGRAMAERHTFAQQTTQFLELYAEIVAAKS
ncbi:MAG: glycosyltransferase family 4 protein [Chthoniobacterales bacterium]